MTRIPEAPMATTLIATKMGSPAINQLSSLSCVVAPFDDRLFGGSANFRVATICRVTLVLPESTLSSGRYSVGAWYPASRRDNDQAYFYEDYAGRLDDMSEGERTERVISDMDEVHPGLRQHLETVITKSWQSDPWEKGAYLVYLPGQLEWYPAICKREGRVWFAGEHASPWPTWMQGAIASGIRAAREIEVESSVAT